MKKNFISRLFSKKKDSSEEKGVKAKKHHKHSHKPHPSDSQNSKSDNPKKHGPNKSASWSIKQFKIPKKEGMTRFHDIGLDDSIMHGIADLGFEYCTPIQAKTLIHASKGENLAGRAQTGTGKTAAFLISVLSSFTKKPVQGRRKPGAPRALVLAPTRELCIQIEKDARALGKYCRFRSVAVYGGMDYEKQQKQIKAGPTDLIAATPGRLLDFKQQHIIDLSQVEVLVIDEADRMLDMGFIPDLKRIIRALPGKNDRRTMLFSATLTDDVMRLASQWMPDPVVIEIDPEQVTVDTVEQIVYAISSNEKFPLLYNILNNEDTGKVLIFRNRRDTTEKLYKKLNDFGISCQMLSGAVSQKQRLRVLEDFRSGKVKIVVATDVAGRGIHVDDISHVINYDFPYESEDYVHRIGRTGRAGVKGKAISFACPEESFIIPDIEEYIGEELPCKLPDEKLLVMPTRVKQRTEDSSHRNNSASHGKRKPQSRSQRPKGRR